jgi:TrmH family RNA methyltransferase
VPSITSRQHALVKTFRRVARGDDRLALLDGWHLLTDALAADLRIETVAVVRGAATSDLDSHLLERARRRRATIVEVSAPVMDALSPVRTPTGVVALIERPQVHLSDLLRPSPALIVLAIDMQDPGNVGAVIRAAEAGGASGIAFAGGSSDPWGWKALRAAMGSTFRLPTLRVADSTALAVALRDAGVAILASVPRGGVPMHERDMRGAAAVAVGGEGTGLSQEFITSADGVVSIPMYGRAESLNVAVAAALLVYEARRQRDGVRSEA